MLTFGLLFFLVVGVFSIKPTACDVMAYLAIGLSSSAAGYFLGMLADRRVLFWKTVPFRFLTIGVTLLIIFMIPKIMVMSVSDLMTDCPTLLVSFYMHNEVSANTIVIYSVLLSLVWYFFTLRVLLLIGKSGSLYRDAFLEFRKENGRATGEGKSEVIEFITEKIDVIR